MEGTKTTEDPPQPRKRASRLRTEPEPLPFFERLAGLTPAQWQAGWKLYVYRVWPVIDKRTDEHFLCKLAETIDEDYLLRWFGSGKYFLRLNDPHGKTATSKTVSLHNQQFPPKVAADEVVATDPRNERYFKAWPESDEPSHERESPAAGLAADSAVREMGRIARAAQARSPVDAELSSLYIKTAEARDALVAKLADQPAGAGAADQLALLEKVLDLVERMQRKETQAPAPPAMLENLNSLAEALKSLREISGVIGLQNSAPGQEWWERLFATPAATQLAASLGAVLEFRLMRTSTPVAASRSPARSQGTQPRPAPPTPTPPRPAPAATVPAPSGTETPATDEETVKFITEIAGKMAQAITNGQPGDQFAESLSLFYGEAVYEQLRSFPLDSPYLSALVPPEDLSKLKEFLQAFQAFGEAPPDESEPRPPAGLDDKSKQAA